MRYLSLEWIEAMQAEVSASESMAALAATHTFGVTQVVTDGPEGNVIYHLQLRDGEATFGPGPAPLEDLRMQQTWDTTVGIATGTIPAQEAFIKGLIALTGDRQKMVDNIAVFGALESAFSAVRERTIYE